MGCLYLEIEGQSCSVGSVDEGLMKIRQIVQLDRMTEKKNQKKDVFSIVSPTRNLSANDPQKKLANFLAKASAFHCRWPDSSGFALHHKTTTSPIGQVATENHDCHNSQNWEIWQVVNAKSRLQRTRTM